MWKRKRDVEAAMVKEAADVPGLGGLTLSSAPRLDTGRKLKLPPPLDTIVPHRVRPVSLKPVPVLGAVSAVSTTAIGKRLLSPVPQTLGGTIGKAGGSQKDTELSRGQSGSTVTSRHRRALPAPSW